ncbi:MAG: DNA repair protein [Candidatus Eisenbacteria bacterium]|nr:DNA repair protein [Planctomycetota bacterium]MCC6653216.1 DNA repair protein [Candidatus Eisenbacteria bacterium]
MKVDVLFRLLWRHALIVEILRAHFRIIDKTHKKSFFEWFGRDKARDERHGQARAYLEQWGDKFWETTEVRVRELITTIEDQIKSNVGIHSHVLELGASQQNSISEKDRQEIIQRAQEVVNQVQIRALSTILDLLDAILDDPQKRYFVVIDRLDEDWVEDTLRLRLIRALIETARDFRKVHNAKVVIALRSDLIARVFRQTRDAGFQEEKYESLYLRIRWTKARLTDMLSLRLTHLVRRKYSPKAPVSLAELLPASIKSGPGRGQKEPGVDFLLSRTLMRPRDAIAFLNQLIRHADGRAAFEVSTVRTAEGEHSRDRLKSLQVEWHSLYPELLAVATRLLGSGPSTLTVGDLYEATFGLAAQLGDIGDAETEFTRAASRYRESADHLAFSREIVSVWYSVGLVGLKLGKMQSPDWSALGQKAVSSAEIQEDTRIYIHPCFWRVLGCTTVHSNFRMA